MKTNQRITMIRAGVIGLFILVSAMASGQMAELPFFSEKVTPPNVMIFVDSSGSMAWDGDPHTSGTQKRMDIVKAALVGKDPYALTKTINYTNYQVYIPHGDTSTVGEFWVGDGLGIRVFRVNREWDTYYCDHEGGYFVFLSPDDVSRNDPDVMGALDTLDGYLRDMNKTCILETANVNVSDDGPSDLRQIFVGVDCTTPGAISFGDAMLMYWEYEIYGSVGGGGSNPEVVVPLEWDDDCYYDGRNWQGCYKPTANLGANRFAIYSDFNITTAEELENYKRDFDDYWSARGKFEAYCPQYVGEVIGDRPHSEWIYDRWRRLRNDGNTWTGRQSYRSCSVGDSGAIRVGHGLPDADTVKTELLDRLPDVNYVDANADKYEAVGTEFVFRSGTRIDIYIRQVLGISPADPPLSDLDITDPNWGGLFDYLYYDSIWLEDPGIMDLYPDVNWGLMQFHNNSGSAKQDFDRDNNDRWLGANVLFQVISWAEFPYYSGSTSVRAQNQAMQDFIKSSSNLVPSGGTPISSALHDIYRYFFNREFNVRTDTNPSMFFNLNWPEWYPPDLDDHIILGDSFYQNGCRRNNMIYLTDGCQTDGEPYSYYISDPSSTQLANIMNRQQELVRMLKNGVNCGTREQKFCGVRSYFIGFALDSSSSVDRKGMQMLTGMAQEAVMDGERDPIDDYMLATDPDELFEAFAKIMAAIMEGQYARTAPEVSVTAGAAITNYFEVSGGSMLWTGHLMAFTQENNAGVITYPPLWGTTTTNDAALILNSTAAADRQVYTMIGGDTVLISSSNVDDLCPEFYPYLDCASGTTAYNDSLKLIKFMRGEDDATFVSGDIVTWKLGGIYHSKPRIVNAPNNLIYYYFPGYVEFATEYAERPSMVMVGTIRGLLHAFSLFDSGNVDAGEELFAYIPPRQLSLLHYLREGKQIAGVDNTPVITDLFFPHDAYNEDRDHSGDIENWERWHTVLVSGMGAGETSYIAIDITDAGTTDATRFRGGVKPMWEFTDEHLSFTWSVPVLGFANYGSTIGYQPAVYFGGGLQDVQQLTKGMNRPNKGGWFYVVNAESGGLIKSFKLWDKDEVVDIDDMTTVEDSNTSYNQVPGSPILLDTNGDNIFDRAYVGDYQGRMWKINMASSNTVDWTQCIVYDMADINGDGDLEDDEDLVDEERMPIWYAPTLAKGPNDMLIIYFYTGHVEIKSDAANDTQLNYMHAIVDNDSNYECTYASQLTLDGTSVNFPIMFNVGEKPTSDMLLTSGLISFTTFTPSTTEPCAPGIISLYLVQYLTGEVTVIDVTPGSEGVGGAGESGGGGIAYMEGQLITTSPTGQIQKIISIPVPRALPMSWGEGVVF